MSLVRHFAGRARAMVCAGVLAAVPPPEASACETAQLLLPQPHATVRSAAPVLFNWAAVAGATGYRVRIAARVPEGRALGRLDTRVQHPPVLLPESMRGEPLAKVAFELETECGTQVSPVLAAEIVLEQAQPCTLPAAASVQYRDGRLTWPAHAASQAYEVCVTGNTGALTCARPATVELALTPDQQPPLLVSIAPVCAGVAGTPRFSVLPAGSAAAR